MSDSDTDDDAVNTPGLWERTKGSVTAAYVACWTDMETQRKLQNARDAVVFVAASVRGGFCPAPLRPIPPRSACPHSADATVCRSSRHRVGPTNLLRRLNPAVCSAARLTAAHRTHARSAERHLLLRRHAGPVMPTGSGKHSGAAAHPSLIVPGSRPCAPLGVCSGWAVSAWRTRNGGCGGRGLAASVRALRLPSRRGTRTAASPQWAFQTCEAWCIGRECGSRPPGHVQQQSPALRELAEAEAAVLGCGALRPD